MDAISGRIRGLSRVDVWESKIVPVEAWEVLGGEETLVVALGGVSAMSYSIGWPVLTQTVVRRERWPGGYKTRGVPLVRPGQEVQPDQPVIRLEKPEPIEMLSTARHLSLPSADSSNLTAIGGADQGQGVKNSGIHTNTSSTETIPAGLRGRVVDITRRGGVVIESRVAVVQGAIGAGNQVAGILTLWQAPGANRGQQYIPPGAILVIPGPVNFAMLCQAMNSGVNGVVASSVSYSDLEGFLHTDVLELVDSVEVKLAQARLPAMTVLLTEGLGTISMPARTMNLLSQYQGSVALLSGTTSVRQRIFPELVISLPTKEVQQNWQPVQPDSVLTVGSPVRVCGGDHEGARGEITYLFTHQQVFASGVRARAARLRLEDGSILITPVTLIERIG